ncbi:MAG: TPM domain-containing protein [Clostridia bacterium]|nr:TPM domain-containing protein [Clostridia bacterium]
MKTFSKRLFSILMLSLLVTGFVCQFASAEDISDMSNDYFVKDNAGVMVYNEVDKLAENARKLHNEYNGLRLMIVTANNLGGESIENYAKKMAKEYGVNTEGRDILVLLAVENQTIHVLLGEEIKQHISVEEANTLIKTYAVPDFEREQYTLGLMALQNRLINEVKNSIQPGVEKNEISTTVTFAQNEANDDLLVSTGLAKVMVIGFFCLVIAVIVIEFVCA